MGASSCAADFNMKEAILSGPVAFCGLRFSNNFSTPFTWTWICSMLPYGLGPFVRDVRYVFFREV